MKKQLTEAAIAAKAIRSELKTNFPGIAFSVRSDNFAGGDAVRISWTDGPTAKRVEEISGKYQYGHFDGMQDMYEYSNSRSDIPQVKFVQTGRDMSDEARQAIAQYLEIKEGSDDYKWGNNVYREFVQMSFPAGKTVAEVIAEHEEARRAEYEAWVINFESEKEQREAEQRRREEAEAMESRRAASIRPRISRVKGDMIIEADFPSLNKQGSIEEYRYEQEIDSSVSKVVIKAIATMSGKDYATFSNMLLHSFGWISEFGGCCVDDDGQVYRIGIVILNEETREWFVVDTQGFSYPRYVGFPVEKKAGVRPALQVAR